MSEEKELKQYATNHYSHYPSGEYPSYLAYGFRPMFLLLAPYIVISIILWSFAFAGYINLSFVSDPLTWHMYEMLYGIGIAGIIAFFLTGAPELFPGTVPIVGRHLGTIIIIWLLGRISFWFMDYINIYIVMILNILPLIWIIALVFKPVVLDPKRRHLSLAFALLILLGIQIFFFLSVLGKIEVSTKDILILALGAFTVLEILALRRINMEAINELLEYEDIDETFYSRAPRYNLAIFCVSLYTILEFLYPDNSILAYIAFASAAAILGIINDFVLKDNNILFKPFVIYMISILVLMACGYGFIGYDYINVEVYMLNHFRHFLTTGVFGLVFYIVMIIISTIHTGRHLFSNFWIALGVVLIIVSTFIRSFIPYYQEYMIEAYIISSILWAMPFIFYMKIFFPFLMNKRADGIPG
ncbi:NnrS family protein [Arcobacter sp. LA11]|uniref:NnrS family protein n=1 Tax=Arcobacter sp. LA11 TaxID=1898176 RepID=UPI00093448A3|nr:NnrS family protein [Arcobacter sp. LA11]